MKRLMFLSLGLLTATLVGKVAAQQSASATFASTPAAHSASAQFALPPFGSNPCTQRAPAPCEPKHRQKSATTPRPASITKADPLAVHPEAAIKQTAAPEITLPGVMKVAGADAHALDFSRAHVVDVSNGGSQTVYVSNVDQNRIQLPWPNTKVVGTNELDIDKRPNSNNVYVQFKEGVQRAVQVYFEQPNGPSVLGLQLVPKRIPAQTILVRDTSVLSGEVKAVKADEHVAAIQALMEQIALGAAPQGYAQIDIAAGPIAMNGVVITPQKQYSSADRDIYVYDVDNPGPQMASLQEKEFDADNVLAISIYPKPILAANERVKVIVLTRKASGG